MNISPTLLNHTYRLFGQIFLNGPTEDLFLHLKSIPDFAQELPNEPDRFVDELAAAHYNLFGLNIYPYQSTFLDPSNNLGGPISNRVLNFYQTIGFTHDSFYENPDHIGVQLFALAYLCGVESELEQNSHYREILQVRANQHRMLKNNLLLWLPALAQATTQQNNRFYHVLTNYTLELTIAHYSALPEETTVFPVISDFSIPDILDNEKTGLKDIAQYLLTPVYSGFYISRNTISALGKNRKIPHGFGSRQQILTNLFRTAVDYEELSQIIRGITLIVDQWRDYYQNLVEIYPLIMPAFITPWLEKLKHTQLILAKVGSAAFRDT